MGGFKSAICCCAATFTDSPTERKRLPSKDINVSEKEHLWYRWTAFIYQKDFLSCRGHFLGLLLASCVVILLTSIATGVFDPYAKHLGCTNLFVCENAANGILNCLVQQISVAVSVYQSQLTSQAPTSFLFPNKECPLDRRKSIMSLLLYFLPQCPWACHSAAGVGVLELRRNSDLLVKVATKAVLSRIITSRS